jgi:hypothetical protein
MDGGTTMEFFVLLLAVSVALGLIVAAMLAYSLREWGKTLNTLEEVLAWNDRLCTRIEEIESERAANRGME